MNYQELKQALGPVKSADVVLGVPDHEYHKHIEFATSSTIKEFMKDPILAGQRRILRTAPPKVWGQSTVKAMRIGRGVHAWVFEGEQVFKHRFPVFSGGDKGSAAWKKFIAENPEAHKNDDILKMEDYKVAERVSVPAIKAWQEYLASVDAQGTNVLAAIPEVSFYVIYESGLKVKVRADMFLLCQSQQNPSQYWFTIIDGKTTSRPVSDHTSLSFAISDLGYDVSGAMYLNTIQDCIQNTALWPKMVPGFDISGWPPVVPLWGQFNIFWMSTLTNQCGFQTLTHATQAEQGTWTENGVAGYYLGLLKMEAEMARLKEKMALEVGKTPEEVNLTETLHVEAPPLKTHHWKLKDRLAEFQHYRIPTQYHNAQDLKVLRDGLTPPPPKKEPKAAPMKVTGQKNLNINFAAQMAPKKKSLQAAQKEMDWVSIAEATGTQLPVKRSELTKWSKKATVAWLEHLGVEHDPKGRVRDLQTQLKEVIFPEGGK